MRSAGEYATQESANSRGGGGGIGVGNVTVATGGMFGAVALIGGGAKLAVGTGVGGTMGFCVGSSRACTVISTISAVRVCVAGTFVPPQAAKTTSPSSTTQTASRRTIRTIAPLPTIRLYASPIGITSRECDWLRLLVCNIGVTRVNGVTTVTSCGVRSVRSANAFTPPPCDRALSARPPHSRSRLSPSPDRIRQLLAASIACSGAATRYAP